MFKNSFPNLQKVILLAMVCVMIFSICPTAFANEESYTVSGQILGLDDNSNVTLYYFLNGSFVSNSVTTAANGSYTIPDIPSGTKITINPQTKTGWTLTPVGQTIDSVTSDVSGVNFMYLENVPSTYSVRGKLSGLSNYDGLFMSYNGIVSGNVPVSTDGSYSIPNVPTGNITFTPPEIIGYNWSGPASITVGTANVSGMDFQYALKKYTITGIVTGISDSVVVKYTLNGGEKLQVTTVAGSYAISDIPYGTDVVIYTTLIEGYTVNLDTISVNNLTGGTAVQDIVYTEIPAETFSVSGVVSGLDNNVGISVRYKINNGQSETMTTGAGGAYTISDIPCNANIKITPVPQTGYSFTPPVINIMDITANTTGQNITYSKNTHTITVNITGLENLNNIQVKYTINNGAEKSVYTDSLGVATISSLYGTNVQIIPSAQTGYSFTTPSVVSNLSADTERSITYTRSKYTVSGVVSGLLNNVNVQLTYKVDGGETQAVITGAGGAFTISDIPYGSTVAINPTPQSHYTADSHLISSVKNNITGILIEYVAGDFNVIYKANGGSGNDISERRKAGSTVTVNENTFKAPSKASFKEWNTTANGTGASYIPGTTFTMSGNDFILYAIWKDTSTGGNGGGGGGGSSSSKNDNEEDKKPVPDDATVQVLAINDDGKTIYEINTVETSGTMLTIKAPKILGHTLQGEETRKITVEKGKNNVTFHYRKDIAVVLEYQIHVKYINGDSGGAVRPDAGITRAEAAVMFFRLVSDEQKEVMIPSKFSDVENGAWYAQAVNYLAKYNVINGHPDGTFRPNDPITRAEFATIASKFDAVETVDVSMFRDVDEGCWARQAINSAALKGWITGFGDGDFRPDAGITRVQAVTIINRMLRRGFEAQDSLIDASPYSDMMPEHWGFNAMIEASMEHEYTRKDNEFEIWK